MIRPFPHKSSHQSWILVKCIQILLDCTRSIPHSMNVLAQNQRLFPFLLLPKLDDTIDGWIHLTEHIHSLRLEITFIMHQSRGNIFFDKVIHGLEIASIERLVSK